jgi:SPP1 gp7 family putative phage head morphogenesis protein
MNKRQKQILQAQLDNEKAVLKKLEATYQDALAEINSKIEILLARQDADMQHVIYQVEYQKALKAQVQAILAQLQNNEFETVSEYLAHSYEDGFIGTMYDLQGQGIPLAFPLDQAQILDAIQHETKLSTSLYTALGHDIKDLQEKIAGEISRGISGSQMYTEIARNVSNYARISKNNAMRIVRTEAHRIQCKATMDAQHRAKDKGADVVKQWDASLDKRTRDSHRDVDGEIRELDEPFSNGLMYPGDPSGRPEEVINCRCALLQRARWALGNDYTKWSPDAPVVVDDDGTTQFVNIDAKSYKEFKGYYKDITGQMTMNFENGNSKRVRRNVRKITSEKVLENNGKSSTIESDIVIHKGVGAKAKNYKVKLPDGEYVEFTEGTRITNIKTIAGTGRDRQIDEVDILVDKYGGTPEEWQKKKGFGYLNYEGESYKAEVHWYEEPTVGKVKFKAKSREGEWIIDDE